ncbi:amino acid ABC transporter permease [Edwardsiella anguillarum]|nr:amino acid ABC transporter permease [Edwardsiella anguillarum]
MELGHLSAAGPFGGTTYLGWIWSGMQVTVALSLAAWVIAFLLGSLLGILRTLPSRPLAMIGAIYVELFRNVPLIVQFLPGIWWCRSCCRPTGATGSKASWIRRSSFCLLAAVPGLFTAARVCEQVRAAIQSLPAGQRHAGLAMGFTLPQTYRYVLLPNAYRVIVPPLTSEMLNLVKNSAIASTIGLMEMAAQAGKLLDYSAHAYESFTAITRPISPSTAC